MNTSQMLHEMCHEILSNTDVKAICKSRGFSAKEAASRALFENFFLSDIGVKAAIGSLTREEIVLLHALKFIGKETGILLFARVYPDELSKKEYYYETFTRRYKDVFKRVKTSLIRKGVLLIAEAGAWEGDSKMERWRFRFPQEFERFLPPLIESTRTFEKSGLVRPAARHKLMEIVGRKQSSPVKSNKRYHLDIVDAELRMGDEPFSAERLAEWQRACWEASIPKKKRRGQILKREIAIPPIQAAVYAFSQLGDNEWIRPGQLSLPLKIFCDTNVSGETICEAGWKWGYLAKQETDDGIYYRLPEQNAQDETSPEHYLHAAPGHPLVVNLETVPYDDLELVAQMSDVQVMVPGEPLMEALPNVVKIGKVMESIRRPPLTQWLRKNAPDFRRALETVEQKWGKQILHENLLVAHVDDLVLRVQLEKTFPNPEDVVFLPNDYIAFPYPLLAEIEKVVAQSGHVIKTVQQND